MNLNIARLIHPYKPGEVQEVDAVQDNEKLVQLMVVGWRQESKQAEIAEEPKMAAPEMEEN